MLTFKELSLWKEMKEISILFYNYKVYIKPRSGVNEAHFCKRPFLFQLEEYFYFFPLLSLSNTEQNLLHFLSQIME